VLSFSSVTIPLTVAVAACLGDEGVATPGAEGSFAGLSVDAGINCCLAKLSVAWASKPNEAKQNINR